MNKTRKNCLSARRLPDSKDEQRQTNPTPMTLKQLSLSFYNSSTKKSRKQVFCDYQQLEDQSRMSDRHQKLKPIARSVSLRKDRIDKKESTTFKTPGHMKELLDLNPFVKPSKSNNFQIKNLVIQNYFNSPYAVPQQKLGGTMAMRTKSQIKTAKKKMGGQIGDLNRIRYFD